ncbi:MAG TPA: hypothetical protein VH234_04205 [Candidatus Saccharimonadales bacterium]|jgi:F-type H+-transporting ATPase subunit epsilon|nr:hypothetical protein [Candidatus Saccharimonadales bacterium]
MSDSGQSTGVDEQRALDEVPAEPVSQTEQEQLRAVTDYSSKDKDRLSMEVKVNAPFRTYYDGRAFSLTAENRTGPFDVLPKHHNFMSLLSPCELIIRTVNKGDQHIKIAGGLLHVKADKVIVFLDV